MSFTGIPFICWSDLSKIAIVSTHIKKYRLEQGPPWWIPLVTENLLEKYPLFWVLTLKSVYKICVHFKIASGNLKNFSAPINALNSILSKAFWKSKLSIIPSLFSFSINVISSKIILILELMRRFFRNPFWSVLMMLSRAGSILLAITFSIAL